MHLQKYEAVRKISACHSTFLTLQAAQFCNLGFLLLLAERQKPDITQSSLHSRGALSIELPQYTLRCSAQHPMHTTELTKS